MWVILLCLLLAPQLSWATAYYAEASGSDANNCTSGAKCQSFSRLVERSLAPGDTLNLKCGETYREADGAISAQSSGTSSSRITVQSYGTCFSQRGVHEGSNNAASLVDVGVNFVAIGVTPGMTVFNNTDASSCNVTSITTTTTINDTLVCAMGLAMGLENTWDVGDRYLIDNRPIVTHASLFSSGWTNQGSNVWSHSVNSTPHRHVWINGWSPNSAAWAGTCSAGAMVGAADQQFCATSTTLFIKSTSNPASRWTSPGVEVIHGSSVTKTTLFHLNTEQWWTVKNITLEKVYGRLMVLTGSNNRVENVRLSWSQRKNCGTNCWQGQDYPWLANGDERGGSILQVNSPSTGTVITGLLGTDCDNNCLTFSGTGSITASVSETEIYNNDHSSINTGLSAGSGATRTITFDRLNLHAAASFFHSDNNGATQTLTVTNSLFYDTRAIDDPRMFHPAGREDPFGIFLEDTPASTYTFRDSLITTGGHGIRIRFGSLTLTRVVIEGNAQTGVHANHTSSVRINDSIIANNGSGTVGPSNFQVGCSFTPCTDVTFTSTSNNNKFHQPSGTSFGYLSGVDTSISLADWQSRFGGNGSSVTTVACFVSASGLDYNLTTGCDDIAALRGPFREITVSKGTLVGTTLTATTTFAGPAPLSTCKATSFTVEYGNVPQTITECIAAPPQALGNIVELEMATAAASGATVELRGNYGAVEDSQRIGGYLNARSRAFGDTKLDNEASGCLTSTNRTVPAGTNPCPPGNLRLILR
jgi:hypothetical protein